MRHFLRILVLSVLLWQGSVAAWDQVARGITQAANSLQDGLFATTDERMRRALGGDADTLFAMRAEAQDGDLWLIEKVDGRIEDIRSIAEFQRLSARNGLMIQLSTLLYPRPILLVAPNTIAEVENIVGRGGAATLCVLAGGVSPGGRSGWSRTHTGEYFELWRFQKD